MNNQINDICEWATLVGNYRFAEKLKSYVKIVERPDFRKLIERRKNERTKYTS